MLPVKRYKIKPNNLTALKLVDDKDFGAAATWCGGLVEETQPRSDGDKDIYLVVPTVDASRLEVRRGWTVIKGQDGKFGVMKTEVFDELYVEDLATYRG